MSFTLNIFLYIYYFTLAVWVILFLAIIYHMFKFGLKTFMTFFLTFIFVAVAILLLNTSYIYISQIDWNSTVTIFPGIFTPNEII